MANRNAFKFKGATVNSATAGNKLCAVSAFSNLIYTVIISTVLLQGLKDSGPHARKLDAYMPHHYVMSLVFLAGASCSLRPIWAWSVFAMGVVLWVKAVVHGRNCWLALDPISAYLIAKGL